MSAGQIATCPALVVLKNLQNVRKLQKNQKIFLFLLVPLFVGTIMANVRLQVFYFLKL